MSDVKSVSRHEEGSGGGGSFAEQFGLIAQQNIAIRVCRTLAFRAGTAKNFSFPDSDESKN